MDGAMLEGKKRISELSGKKEVCVDGARGGKGNSSRKGGGGRISSAF